MSTHSASGARSRAGGGAAAKPPKAPSMAQRQTAAHQQLARAVGEEAPNKARLTAVALEAAAREAERNPAFAAQLREAYQQSAPPPKAARADSTAKAAEPRATPEPRPDSQLRTLEDPTNPNEAWDRFGGTRDGFYQVLAQEPLGPLERMAYNVSRESANPVPRTATTGRDAPAINRARLASYIADEMAGRNLQINQATASRLLPRDVSLIPALDPHWIRAAFGDAQLSLALNRYSQNHLRAGARRLGIPSGGTRDQLRARIIAHVQSVPMSESIRIANENTQAERNHF